jgi:hypothetical protein
MIALNGNYMARIFIWIHRGLGRAAALALLADGPTSSFMRETRHGPRAWVTSQTAPQVVLGDLGKREETYDVSRQVNTGRMDAVIPTRASISTPPRRRPKHARTLAVGVLAPMLTGSPASRPADLHLQRYASGRRRILARHRLDVATLEQGTGLLGQQALRRRAVTGRADGRMSAPT